VADASAEVGEGFEDASSRVRSSEILLAAKSAYQDYSISQYILREASNIMDGYRFSALS